MMEREGGVGRTWARARWQTVAGGELRDAGWIERVDAYRDRKRGGRDDGKRGQGERREGAGDGSERGQARTQALARGIFEHILQQLPLSTTISLFTLHSLSTSRLLRSPC